MRKPNDAIKVNDQVDSDMLCDFYSLAYTYIEDYGMSAQAAGELAEVAIRLRMLEDLKNYLEHLQ